MSASIITVDLSDSGFLVSVKVFLSGGVSISLWSWGVGWQKVTNSLVIT